MQEQTDTKPEGAELHWNKYMCHTITHYQCTNLLTKYWI